MPTCTWNPSNIGTNYTLSNGNLTWLSANSSDACGFATLGYLAGTGSTPATNKLYFEQTVNIAGSSEYLGAEIGIGNSTQSLSAFLGASGSICAEATSGAIFSADGIGAGPFSGLVTGNGGVMGIYVDFGNQKAWFTNDGITFYGFSGTQNPATNTGGFGIPNAVLKPGSVYTTVYPGFGSRQVGPKGTANFSGPFSLPVAAGFSAWGGSAPSVSQFMMGG